MNNCDDSVDRTSSPNVGCDRRIVLQRSLLLSVASIAAMSGSLATPAAALALESSNDLEGEEKLNPLARSSQIKPYAPLEALLPAARVKLLIDRAVQLSRDLSEAGGKDDLLVEDDKLQKLRELEDLLLKPQKFTRSSQSGIPTQPAKQYMDSYRQSRERLSLLEKPGAALIQSGDIATWKRLKRQERLKEQSDEIRAAFNGYTTSLSYSGESYVLNVPRGPERSKLIREDRLPDVKSVIAADMDLRYLYRNEVLNSMEDARAELQYQLANSSNTAGDGDQQQQNQQQLIDPSELLSTLKRAQEACDRWFSFVDDGDVREALNAATLEQSIERKS